MAKVEEKLAELGMVLPTPAAPVANYVPFVRTGSLLVVSGQICLDADGKLVAKGKLGDGVSIEDGQKAARACAINLLAQVKVALGDLDKVVRVVRLGGFINSAPTFLDGPKVMNGASDLMVEVFGDKGRHARTHRRRRGAAGRRRGRGRGHVRSRRERIAMQADWLIARPVAHRGLHDAAAGIIENTPSAFAAAIAANYAIECDLQISADGEAMVYHDETLDRLTEGSGRLDAMPAAELKRVPFSATADRMITLGELCDLVAGRPALFVEIKSRFDGDLRLVTRAAEVLARLSRAASR